MSRAKNIETIYSVFCEEVTLFWTPAPIVTLTMSDENVTGISKTEIFLKWRVNKISV